MRNTTARAIQKMAGTTLAVSKSFLRRTENMRTWLTAALLALVLGIPGATYAKTPALRGGAGKVDVTPAPNELPQNYEGILDHLYSRAIVVDNGSSTAALITLDAGGVPDAVWQAVSRQLE